jgi:Anti-sigma-K factor rskA
MPHLSDDIPRLLTGDASREEVLAAAEHLRSCPDCQQELVSAVVAHASLTSAHRFAPDIMAADPDISEDASVGPLPDLSAMFEQVRSEAAVASSAPAAGLRHRRRLIAVAAAAAVVLGGGGVIIAETVGSSSSDSSVVTVSLRAFDKGHSPAVAKVSGKTMRIDATDLPRLDSGHWYEVWLTDGARKRMQSLGAIGSDNRAQLTVPANVMAEYSAIEVSVQRTNETAYSGVSVLRGAYRS